MVLPLAGGRDAVVCLGTSVKGVIDDESYRPSSPCVQSWSLKREEKGPEKDLKKRLSIFSPRKRGLGEGGREWSEENCSVHAYYLPDVSVPVSCYFLCSVQSRAGALLM